MSSSEKSNQNKTLIKSFMLENGDQSSIAMTNLLLVSIVLTVTLTLITVFLKVDLGYIPHIMGLSSLIFYVLHIQYVYHRLVDPQKKTITLYSGRKGNLKPSTIIKFDDIYCVALDFKVVRGNTNSNHKSYFQLVAIDKKGKKFDLSYTEKWKCPVILHKAELYASIFDVPFVDTKTSIGFSITFDPQGNVIVLPIESKKLHKWAEPITYVILLVAIMGCVWSFFIM